MQFALRTISGKHCFVHANEVGWICQVGSAVAHLSFDISALEERMAPYRLVYGCFLENIWPVNPESIQVTKGMEMAYLDFIRVGTFAGHYRWRKLKIVDVETWLSEGIKFVEDGEFEPQQMVVGRIALAAVVRLSDEIPTTPNSSIAAFPFNPNTSIQSNILRRPGIFAFNDEDRRKGKMLPTDHWRLLINHRRAAKAARRVG